MPVSRNTFCPGESTRSRTGSAIRTMDPSRLADGRCARVGADPALPGASLPTDTMPSAEIPLMRCTTNVLKNVVSWTSVTNASLLTTNARDARPTDRIGAGNVNASPARLNVLNATYRSEGRGDDSSQAATAAILRPGSSTVTRANAHRVTLIAA